MVLAARTRRLLAAAREAELLRFGVKFVLIGHLLAQTSQLALGTPGAHIRWIVPWIGMTAAEWTPVGIAALMVCAMLHRALRIPAGIVFATWSFFLTILIPAAAFRVSETLFGMLGVVLAATALHALICLSERHAGG